MIETALLWLLTNANAASRLGAIIGEDMFPDELPQDPPYPSVVYQAVAAPRGYTMDGQDGATPFRFQFDCYGRTFAEAIRLREALRLDLSGFAGLVPISPPIRIHGAFADNEGDSAMHALERAGPRVKRKSLDFTIWTKEG